ncbi:MAG: class I tRNA ligase family protein, partial [Candidatus Nomurabacteria bacterium]|nr:class I tRNA ligase family protein [Candidatus Nomurabacteria bacterium]
MKRYNPSEIEPKWQQIWETSKIYAAHDNDNKPKKYLAEMLPYPSGAGLHVGHVRNFTIVDALARFYRQQGFNVLRPFGYDEFGLPTENYAIKTGVSPIEATRRNVENFRNQAKRMGYAIDWSREIHTSSPEYYKWTQWIFTKLFEKGLAYQKKSAQWWCSFDKTVLANEQVEAGKCWRCGNEVEKKMMKQWFFKITEYADELLDAIDDLDWPEKIKTMQRNWIGKSQGAEIDFEVVSSS